MPNLDPLAVKLQIDALFREFPEMVDDELLRADMIEGSTDIHKFLSTAERVRQEAVAMVKGTDLVMADLLHRKRRFERRDEALRRLMFKLLQMAGVRTITLPEATLSLRNGTPSVIITDESALPNDLCRFKREPDKTKIKASLQTGTHVPGATLSNAEENLTILTK